MQINGDVSALKATIFTLNSSRCFHPGSIYPMKKCVDSCYFVLCHHRYSHFWNQHQSYGFSFPLIQLFILRLCSYKAKTNTKVMSHSLLLKLVKFKPTGITQLVERRALGYKVMGSNLPVVPEVTLGGLSSGSFTIPRCKTGTRSWSG